MALETDVVVIGMGPGGEDVAGRLAEDGLDVVGVERHLVGGECPYWGCVPSKMMIRAANLLAEARRIAGMAGDATVRADWAPVARRIREQATDHWDDRVAVERFEHKGGRFLRGDGRVLAPGRVSVDGAEVVARRGIVIATGSRAVVPPIDGIDEVPYWTNHEAIEAEQLPRSLVLLGGGAIGVELAQVLVRFGVQVTIVEAADRLLGAEEPEAGEIVRDVLEREGANVLVGRRAVAVRNASEGITVQLEDGTEIAAERLLVAVGRRVDLRPLALEALGLDSSARALPVDHRMRVIDGLWAVGDVTGYGAFTHVALYQSSRAVADILGEEPRPVDYEALSRVTFSDPEVGAVGLSEHAARERGIDVRVGHQRVAQSARGWIHGPGNEGFIKLVADAERGVLVGATSVGPMGGEVLGLLSLAVHAAVPLDVLRSMIYAYPTFHRGIEDALRDLMAS